MPRIEKNPRRKLPKNSTQGERNLNSTKKRLRRKRRNKKDQRGVQGEEAHHNYTGWKPQTAEQRRAQARIHARTSVLVDPNKIYAFKRDCKNQSGFAKDVIKVWSEDMFEAADKQLRSDVSRFAEKGWGENGKLLASEFLEQRTHFTPKELVEWRRKQIEIDLAVEFLDWVKKQQTEWARSQRSK